MFIDRSNDFGLRFKYASFKKREYMDYHKEIRQSYLGGFSILLIEGFFWILAGILWSFVSFKVGILVIIISGTFFIQSVNYFKLF